MAADLTFLLVGAVPLAWAVLLLVFGERAPKHVGEIGPGARTRTNRIEPSG
jgi:hypothetical protein